MKDPIYQRAEMFHAVIQHAGNSLSMPIDRIEFVDDRFVVVAERSSLTVQCIYHNQLSKDGVAMPGSGSWSAYTVDEAPGGRPLTAEASWRTWLRRVFRG